jgi:polyhydroxyalkanoate synthesis regulator phasin
MKKLVATGLVAASLAGGSVAVTAFAPLGLAGAQDSGTPTTTAPPSSATPSAPDRANFLDDALKSLVDDGTINQDQADKIKSRVQDNAKAARAQLGERKLAGPLGVQLDKAADVLGISVDDLKAQLKEGKTLKEIAGDKRDALVAALTDAANARIDQAVTDGKLAADKAADLKTKTADRIAKAVDEGVKLPGRGHGGRGLRGGW